MSDDTPLAIATAADDVAVKTMIRHQRMDNGSCLCGWGARTSNLGDLHSLHVWRKLQAAGVALAPVADPDPHTTSDKETTT